MSTNVVRNNLAYGNAQGDFLSYYGSTTNTLFQLGTNLTGHMPLFVSPRTHGLPAPTSEPRDRQSRPRLRAAHRLPRQEAQRASGLRRI